MKLRIIKNKKVVDANNQFTYAIEIYGDDGDLYRTEIIKIPATQYMLPDEKFFSYEPTLKQFEFTEKARKDDKIPTDETMPSFDVENVKIEEIVIE